MERQSARTGGIHADGLFWIGQSLTFTPTGGVSMDRVLRLRRKTYRAGDLSTRFLPRMLQSLEVTDGPRASARVDPLDNPVVE
jgi:hypothetical protein